MTRILVSASDPSAAAETAEYAMQVADALNAVVVALHVIRPGRARDAGELTMAYFEKAAEENGISLETHVLEGLPRGTIVEFAEANEVDLIVMGASNGNTAEQWICADVRNHTTVPVLVIPNQIID